MLFLIWRPNTSATTWLKVNDEIGNSDYTVRSHVNYSAPLTQRVCLNQLNLRPILTTNLAECVCVCVCAKCDQFLPQRSHFFFKLPEKKIRIAKFPYAAFRPLFAFHCPIFFTKNNTLNGVCMLNVTAAH